MKGRYIVILLALSFIVLAVYSGSNDRGNKYEQTREIVILRKMVHELLLSSGDSTTRILPVKQVSETEYHLIPEKRLFINPDSFVNIVNKTVKEGKLPVRFTASVIKSQDKQMVFGFAAAPSAGEGDVACLGRKLPEDNYYIRFVFAPKSKISSMLFASAAVFILSLIGFWFWKRNKKVQSEPHDLIVEEDINNKEGYIKVGKYLFNIQQQELELDGEKIALTIKETKVLQILAASPNAIIERDTIQKEVWENEGVIVTRSLDMFISKLRKKLSADLAIKIVNVHGKGYKLQISNQ